MSSEHVAVCGKCNRVMSCEEVGITLEMQANGRPYYLIQADLYRCPGCGLAVYSEFGKKVHQEHPRFDQALAHHPDRVRIT